MNIRTRVIPAVALVFALAACGQADPEPTATGAPVLPTGPASPTTEPTTADVASPTADAGAPAGWQRITVADRGFSLAIPADWEEVSADTIADSGAMDEMLGANPDAADAIEQGAAALESGQIALFAFDASEESVTSGFATNVNAINVGPVDGNADEAADEIADAIEQTIPVVGAIETSTVSLPAGDAALIRYEWEIDDGAGTTTVVTVTQYAIIADTTGTGFILSFSVASDRLGEYEETFRQIAESFAEETA